MEEKKPQKKYAESLSGRIGTRDKIRAIAALMAKQIGVPVANAFALDRALDAALEKWTLESKR